MHSSSHMYMRKDRISQGYLLLPLWSRIWKKDMSVRYTNLWQHIVILMFVGRWSIWWLAGKIWEYLSIEALSRQSSECFCAVIIIYGYKSDTTKVFTFEPDHVKASCKQPDGTVHYLLVSIQAILATQFEDFEKGPTFFITAWKTSKAPTHTLYRSPFLSAAPVTPWDGSIQFRRLVICTNSSEINQLFL